MGAGRACQAVCGACEGVPDSPSPGSEQAASPPPSEFPRMLLLVVQGCVVWLFSPLLAPSKKVLTSLLIVFADPRVLDTTLTFLKKKN